MPRGEATRLFLLAELARRGRSHGHELRREARIGRAELWTDVGVGAIYSTLRRMADEGLIESVRSEREGNMPERTVYTLTAEGRRELEVLRESFLLEVHIPADPFDLAFSVSADVPAERLRAVLEERLAILHARIGALERQRVSAAQHLDVRDQMLFEHLLARLRTEVDWHRLLVDTYLPAHDAEPDIPESPHPEKREHE